MYKIIKLLKEYILGIEMLSMYYKLLKENNLFLINIENEDFFESRYVDIENIVIGRMVVGFLKLEYYE